MIKIILLMMFLSGVISAQGKTSDSIRVSEDAYECVDSVYNSPDAIKLLLTRLVTDKEYFRKVHREIMDDPELREAIRDLVRNNRKNMGYRNNDNKEDSE